MAISKHASWWNTTKEVGKQTLRNPYFQAAALPIIGMGVDAGVGALRQAYQARQKGQAYKEMLAETPMLKNKPQARVQRYFNTLHRANPEMAQDPLVAGSWVATQISQEVPGHPHAGVVEGVSQLAKIRQMTREPSTGRGGPFRQLGTDIGKTLPDIHKGNIMQGRKDLDEAIGLHAKEKDETFAKQKERFEALRKYEDQLMERQRAITGS